MPRRSVPRRALAVALVSLTMLVSLCLGDTSDSVGDEAKDFTVLDVDGTPHNLTDYRGKVLVVDFFATWCGPCAAQLEELLALWPGLNHSTVAFLTIDIDDRESQVLVASYRDANGIGWPVAYQAADVGTDYNVDAIPTLVVIDGDGVIRFYHTGVVSMNELRETILDLL
jgi:thiol-disulfide isomerase/thioredoxin